MELNIPCHPLKFNKENIIPTLINISYLGICCLQQLL